MTWNYNWLRFWDSPWANAEKKPSVGFVIQNEWPKQPEAPFISQFIHLVFVHDPPQNQQDWENVSISNFSTDFLMEKTNNSQLSMILDDQ